MDVTQTPKLLSVEEAAQMLGKTPAQLRYMIHMRTAPLSAKIGGRRVFRESDIESFIAAAFDAAAEERQAAHA